ncbi:hypothetical protein BFG57_02730 [Bacillus solimangrovi]|uniref:Flagellin n=1 Tax=Bacillus solimangrovi TaxID=1305675 RepID=A0A1E5LDN5_9BACI|nr:flagellin [Bacillus solimangrovi]OEH92203.1 hypothetical protein BFG57_02730 [Bacillus solimangrovi]
MIINHNLSAMNTYRQMGNANKANANSMEKLSSGLRINRAGDDAAGLAISEKMRAQVRGLDQASRNAQDGISLIQTAEGALQETHSILQRMRELAVQSSNDTATDPDREEMQKEISQLKDEIDRISGTTEFNTKTLFDGSLEKAGLSKATKLESIQLDGTATQGTGTGANALQATTTISTGVNDQINLNVDGAGAQAITIAQGQYTSREDLVTAVNDAIGNNANLAGKVTAELTSDNKLSFISASTGMNSGVAVTAVSNISAGQLGFSSAITDSTAAYALTAGNINVTAGETSLDIKLGARTAETIDLTNYGMSDGDTVGENQETVDALQAAFDDKFGAGAVSVTFEATGDTDLIIKSSLGAVSLAAGSTNDLASASGTFASSSVAGKSQTFAATFNAGSSVGGADATETAGATTRLVSLGDGSGNNLGLQSGNQINISVIVGGEEKTGTFAVTGTNTLQDLADSIRDTIGGTANVTVDSDGQLQITGQQGEAFALSNLTLTAQVSAADSTEIAGNFANKLSSYSETQAADDSKVDSSLSFHIGANQGQTMKVDINEMSVQSLSLSSIDISSQQGAETGISVINNAIETVSAERSKLGAFQNRLEHTINNLGTASENLTAAESRIRDVDMAKEMMNQTKESILAQASQAMLAKANQNPQGVLQLLR